MALGQQRFYNILDHTDPECADWVVVNWNLGNMCNFKCSYCPPKNNGSFGRNDYEVVRGFVDSVIEHYVGRKIYFEFTGGEVTLWRDLTRLAKYVLDLKRTCNLGLISMVAPHYVGGKKTNSILTCQSCFLKGRGRC